MVDAPYGLEPEFKAIPSFAQREPSFAEYLSAEGASALQTGTSSIYRMVELASANTDPLYFGQEGEPPRRLSAEDVTARAESKGVKLPNLGTGSYTEAASDIMIDRAVRRQFRDTVISAYQPSGATALGTSLIASLADPLNIAAAFIPVVPEARVAEALAKASGILGRTGIRVAQGAAEGAVGMAAIEPFRVFAETQEGQDWQLADSMRNIAFGGVFGAGLHAGIGAAADKLLARRFTTTPPESVPEIIDRLPEETQQAALTAAIADAIHGTENGPSAVIDAFMKTNPDIAKDTSFSSTLRRDGPPLDDIVGRTAYWEQELASLKSPPKKPVSFLAWLKQQGGLRDVDNDIRDFVGDTTHLGKGYISQKGALKTERGLTFDDLFEKAKAEGYVTTRQELRDAFQPGAEIVKGAERDAVKAHEEKAAYIQKLLTEAGVNPKTRNQIKARAIAGREQHIYTAEQARLAQSVSKLEDRRDAANAIKNAEAKKVPQYQYERSADVNDTGVQPGDTVHLLDESGLPSEAEPRTVKSIIDDPNYGRYAFFEGSETGFPAHQMQIHQRGVKAEAAAVEPPKAEKPKPDEKTGEYTFEQFAAELKDAFDTTRGSPVSTQAMKERLPGLTDKQIKKYVQKLIRSDDVAGFGKGVDKRTEMISKKQHPNLQEQVAASIDYGLKVEQARRNLDMLYPNMADQRTYYLQAIVQQAGDLNMGMGSLRRHLEKEIAEGRLKAFDEETGQALTKLRDQDFNTDYSLGTPGTLLTFADKTIERAENTRQPSLFPDNGEPVILAGKVKVSDRPLQYEYRVTQNGKQVATIKVGPEGRDLHMYNFDTTSGKPHELGAKGVREVIDRLRRDFPDAENLTGDRISGARAAAGVSPMDERTFMKLPLKKEQPRPEVPAEPPRIETPPADRDALNPTELQKATQEYQALQEATLRKYEAIAANLPPETAAMLRQSLDRVSSDADELEKILESATSCMVRSTG